MEKFLYCTIRTIIWAKRKRDITFDMVFVRRSKVLEIHVMLQLKLRPTEAVCKHHKNTRKHSSWNSEPKLQWVHILYIIMKINFYSLSSWFVTNTFNEKTSWSILTTNHAKQHNSVSCGVFCLKAIWQSKITYSFSKDHF